MKKIIMTAVLAIAPLVTFAQSAFDKFRDVKGVEYVSVTKDMFNMLGKFEASASGEKAEKFVNMAKGLESVRVFTTSEKKYRKEITSAVADYLKGNPLEELVSYSGKDSKIKVYVNQGGEATLIKEGLVFIEDLDDKGVVLVSFTGTINLDDLKSLK